MTATRVTSHTHTTPPIRTDECHTLINETNSSKFSHICMVARPFGFQNPKGLKFPSAKSVLELQKATHVMNTRDSLLILRMAVPTIIAIVPLMLGLQGVI